MAATTRHLTILLTDIKGFTDRTSHQTRNQIVDLLERHKSVVLPVLEGKGGRLVKTIGDAFLMAFDSPTDAVLAGTAVQDALRAHNEGRADDERIEIRIAINCGEVTLADNDVFGEPVNITARIESVAEAGEVFFTEAVYLSMNKAEVPSAEVGLLQLKGIPEKVRVYKVKRETPLGANAAPPKKGPGLREPAPKAAFAKPDGAVATAAPERSEGESFRTPIVASVAKAGVARRAGSVIFDFMLCAVVSASLFPSRDGIKIRKRIGSPAVVEATHDGKPVDLKDSDVNIGFNGVNIKSRKGNVAINSNGIKTTSADGSFELGDSEDDSHGLLGAWKFPLIWVIYSVLCLKRLGSTLGGKIFKLAVVRTDGKPLEKGDRWTRAVMSFVSGIPAGLGYFWALLDKDGRGWHDLVAGTRVVRVD